MRVIALVLSLVVAITACSGSDDTPSGLDRSEVTDPVDSTSQPSAPDGAAIEALERALLDDQGARLGLDLATARCVITEIADRIDTSAAASGRPTGEGTTTDTGTGGDGGPDPGSDDETVRFDPSALDGARRSLLASAIVGCADSGQVAGRAVDALTDDAEVAITSSEAECVGERVSGELGAVPLVELSLHPDGLSEASPEILEALGTAFMSCSEIEALIAESISEDTPISAEDAACIVATMNAEGALEALFRQMFETGEPDQVEMAGLMLAAARECLPPDALARLAER